MWPWDGLGNIELVLYFGNESTSWAFHYQGVSKAIMGPSQAGTEEVLAPGMVEGTNKVAL